MSDDAKKTVNLGVLAQARKDVLAQAYADGRRDAERDRLRARRAARKTGKDMATYPMLINVMQHLTEWGFEVHWEGDTLMLLHPPSAFTEEQLKQLQHQQCMPSEDGECMVMHFKEDD